MRNDDAYLSFQVIIAIFCPTGRTDEAIQVELNSQLLRVQSKVRGLEAAMKA